MTHPKNEIIMWLILFIILILSDGNCSEKLYIAQLMTDYSSVTRRSSLLMLKIWAQSDFVSSFPTEPMYPQQCVSSRVFNPTGDRKPSQCLPTELMRTLTSLNCSLTCQKEDPLSLMQLVIEVRSGMINVSFLISPFEIHQFWTSAVHFSSKKIKKSILEIEKHEQLTIKNQKMKTSVN